MEKVAEAAENAALLERACETANETRGNAVSDTRAQLELLRQNKQEQDEKLDTMLDALGSGEQELGPIRDRLHEISDSIEQLEREIAVKQAELEELERSKAEPTEACCKPEELQ